MLYPKIITPAYVIIHWNLSSYPPTKSSNFNFFVRLATFYKKKKSHEIHGAKCYEEYLESMESMNTTILWYNKTFNYVETLNFVVIWKIQISIRLLVGFKPSRLGTAQYVMPIYLEHCEDKTHISLLVTHVRRHFHDFLTL